MKYKITHTTTYAYSDPVAVCQNVVRLTPRNGPHQRCLAYKLGIKPKPDHVDKRLDYFGNQVHNFAIAEAHNRLVVKAVSRVEVLPPELPEPADSPPWESVRDALKSDLTPAGLEARQFLYESPFILFRDDIRDYAARSFTPRRPILAAAIEFMHRVKTEFVYDQSATTIHTPLEVVFRQKRGVCQDFAHLMIAGLRSVGLPARYVSGYLRTIPREGQPHLVGNDASHAWLAVYAGPLGWVDLDPTNDLIVGDEHVVCAWGRDYADVSPVRGVILGGGAHGLTVAVDLIPQPD